MQNASYSTLVQSQKCRGCGCDGELPRIVYSKSPAPAVVLRPVFVDGAGCLLLCDACRIAQRRHDQRRLARGARL